MDYYYHPQMSSLPHYNDYRPSGSQPRSDRATSSSDDHQYKRRRVDFENTTHRHMADPSHPSSAPAPTSAPTSTPSSASTSVPTSGNFIGTNLPGIAPLMNSGIFMAEDAALEYLNSRSGFAQDLRGIDSPFSYLPAGQPPRAADLSAHLYPNAGRQESGFANARLPTGNIFHDPRELGERSRELSARIRVSEQRLRESSERLRESSERLRESQHLAGEPPRSVTASHFGYSVDWTRSPQQSPAGEPLSSHWEPPSSAASPQKPPIMLVLSRATAEGIEALEDHKRECPACQLEFEQDHFMAVITCCDTAMHATCLSAWVNSVTYSKSKACMKCRRSIDARRILNNVVPPVNDKTWDEGVEFNAPESLKGDAKIELNISAKPERARMRRFGHPAYYPGFRSGRSTFALPDTLGPEARSAVLQYQEVQMRITDEVRLRSHAAYTACTRANQDDISANRALLEAQVRGEVSDLTPLVQRCETTRLAREKAREVYHKTQLELEAVSRTRPHRLHPVIDDTYWVNRYGDGRSAEDEPARNPTLYVVTGESFDPQSP
ncbi:hypothetical protein AYL99_04478 [Fonsecaea erecta]|uniref:RING-type domain-containing protein n=1 Tax=Fonsecaea erecta TaxID=1367422 RepID=A0A178ZTD6_9EURO|nr:hypothetical protein AYL99_04478 [Fonsecaea erecta]OAP62275.1 hypothetical protein AYL99_04478 [Fonsecaea erecta]